MPQNIHLKAAERELPTLFVEGFFHFFIILVLSFGLIWEQNGLVYLSVLLLVMINGARLWCRLSLKKVSYSLEMDRFKVFPGESVKLEGEVKGSGLLPIWLQIGLPLAEGLLPDGKVLSTEANELLYSGLLWRERLPLDWSLTAKKRGWYKIGPLSLQSSDLLGFFQQKKVYELSSHLTVFPRIVSLNPLPVPFEEFFGDHSAKSLLEDPVYPIATRDYQPGRPARFINWKASLRHNRLQEKVFEPTQRRKILLAIDTGGFNQTEAEDAESFEALLEVAATLALRLDITGSSLGLLSNGLTLHGKPAVLPLLWGETHLMTMLETLAVMQMAESQGFAGLLRQSHEFTRGSSCFYFAKGSDETKVLAELFNEYRIPVIFILQNPGVEMPEQMTGRVFKLDEVHGGGEAFA